MPAAGHPALQTGLLVLHGNRAETLAQAVLAWTQRHPLQPLEEEIFLVQSNGVAEWLKMSLAAQAGVCAAVRVELPARFLWRTYRQQLGREAVPALSPLDKQPLAWRLMQWLPGLAEAAPAGPGAGGTGRAGQGGAATRPGDDQPAPHHASDAGACWQPLAGFLRGGDIRRRWQLANKLADLFDQYQVYRADWLDTWAAGHDVLAAAGQATPVPVPDAQRWQPALWRALLQPLSAAQRDATRPRLHQRFLQLLQQAAPGSLPGLPRRVVLFGMTHLPWQTLQTLAALAEHAQVLLAVPNPCRYHWADIIDGRELLRAARQRLPLREGLDLAAVPLAQMHAHAHPLLAAWGRQGRDFVRQLDAFDDAQQARERFPLARLDLFDDGPGQTLLQQLQARIRDLVPLAEHAALNTPVADADRSLAFHIAHGPQREVEILHDQLLHLLADPPGGVPLAPRDIVVMVPDIEVFAPAIRSVFGQHARGDARVIPYAIADLQERGRQPLLVAVEWLARLPEQRCRASELRDLLQVPAVAARLGVAADDLPVLARWIEGAGLRWGLDAEHRSALGLGAAGETGSWLFALRRMLLGYACGSALDEPVQGVLPYPEVGGLEAPLAGALATLLQTLQDWHRTCTHPATPLQWAERFRALLAAVATPTDDSEQAALALLEQSLQQWLQACEAAGFGEPLPLEVAREAWLEAVDAPALNRRFRAGGVTFCTLLPMRTIPFEVVCLLGMNDGDYPRSTPRSDFDLMALPGQARPGDRSRSLDDRQLMLEAVLSARRVLYVSWTGRSARDNSVLPPSMLVSQLREHLAAAWHPAVVEDRTTVHPLQPFSRRYFEQPSDHPAGVGGTHPPGRLFTHAREWRAAHQPPPSPPQLQAGAPAAESSPGQPPAPAAVDLARLAAFLRNPVKHHFKTRLGVVFDEHDAGDDDDEVFDLQGLPRHAVLRDMVAVVEQALAASAPVQGAADDAHVDVAPLLARAAEHLRLAGRLPLAGVGRRLQERLALQLQPMLWQWHLAQQAWPVPLPRLRVQHAGPGGGLDDWVDGLRGPAAGGSEAVWLQLMPQALLSDGSRRAVATDKLVQPWLQVLAAGAAGLPLRCLLVGTDAMLDLPPPAAAEAETALCDLLQAYAQGLDEPLPLARKTAVRAMARPERSAAPVYDGSLHLRGEREEPCLGRCFPDHAALVADGRFHPLAERVYGPLVRWATGASVQRLAQAGGSRPVHADAA